MIGETVTVHRRTDGGVDGHGNPVPSWTDETVSGVAVAPRAGEEQGGGARETVVIGLTLYMPAETVLAAVDEVTVRGVRHAVIGDPGLWSNPYSGVPAGVQVALERIEG